ncbi:hypothetical protein, conserved [Angomonas deanei]|uniref:Uncharacterized protein n=1 Tax=Angomonas deanei TaxID=59799 RepID=A0A7G2C3J1_9TRYP|nr:hypothetical protein, conserved [Angomonas deanei]
MGAVPSAESSTATLSQCPSYGQRQHIILIPLVPHFFPDATCPLFQQLYEARRDPAVRYYHYLTEATLDPAEIRSKQEKINDNLSNNSNPNEEEPLLLPVDCPPPEVFPTLPLTPQELYDLYMTQCQQRTYETDWEMLSAFQKEEKHQIRPLPCAVAFLYQRKNNGPAKKEGEEPNEEEHNEENENQSNNNNKVPEDCVEVQDCYVKVTGLLGDTSLFFQNKNTSDNIKTDMELSLYLTKSAGDHNRTHVLLSAIYTYAEQWQRAVQNCLYNHPSDTNEDNKMKELLVSMLPTVDVTWTSKTPSESKTESTLTWVPPPLPRIFMRARRTNVPFLCFSREVRNILLSMHLSHNNRNNNNNEYNKEVLGEMDMWLQDVETTAQHHHNTTESFLYVHVPEKVGNALVRFVMNCLLRHTSPLENLRDSHNHNHEHHTNEVIAPFRLPDAPMIVEEWRREYTVNDLKRIHPQYLRDYLYFVVRPTRRRAATLAVQEWLESGGEIIADDTTADFLALLKSEKEKKESSVCLPSNIMLCFDPLDKDTPVSQRPLFLRQLPLEELLLGELGDACKVAREATATDPSWVRDASYATAQQRRRRRKRAQPCTSVSPPSCHGRRKG